jgi:hypothetical protein
MKKKKTIITTLFSIIGLIFLDFIIALSLSNTERYYWDRFL